jgi:phosphoesterase RecJ-like protein
MHRKVINDILTVLRRSNSFFLTSHINPDGDSIACETAMALFLERLGKRKYVIANRDGAPEIYKFLPRAEKVRKAAKVTGQFDVALILDASDPDRIGNIIDLKKQAGKVIVIDHHLSAIPFGDLNYLDQESASCAEQIYNLIKTKFAKPTKNEAISIYTGIMTETNKFQEANTNPAALRTAALLIEAGVNPMALCKKIYEQNSLEQIKLLGHALSGVELKLGGKVATLMVTCKMLKETGASLEHCEGTINFARSIKGVRVAVLFREQENGFKISLRSKDDTNVNKIAVKFGGGGHRRAAGFFLPGPLSEVKGRVLSQIKNLLNK